MKKKEMQDDAQNYFNRYKVSNFWYLIIFLLKCFIRLILPNKIIDLLKKLLKKNK